MPKFQPKAKLAVIQLSVFFLLLSGCAGISHLTEQPTVSVADIKVQEVKNLETTFLVQLRVMNPNDVALQIKSATCNLDMEGRRFATGVSGAEQEIPANGTALVPIQVYASMFNMIGSVVNLLQASNIASANIKPMDYHLTGTLRVSVSGFNKDIPFDNSGQISLNGISQTP